MKREDPNLTALMAIADIARWIAVLLICVIMAIGSVMLLIKGIPWMWESLDEVFS